MGKWLQQVVDHMKKGALHKQMGVPMGHKIPMDKLMAATHAQGKEGQRARFALLLRKFHKGK